ncbi:hypothetical protein SMF913_25024 [Streptomyces malaysiensis]|uniref:Uncharacterized protein n=1 Tax=Streptomyces malaysiensis TaxID=92644 RepID=A0A2J7YNR7_STRMQ|nr:hypothetical protein SMF913_25024 [Streptomyces malaysiensis]
MGTRQAAQGGVPETGGRPYAAVIAVALAAPSDVHSRGVGRPMASNTATGLRQSRQCVISRSLIATMETKWLS